jgi:hypothetical protein
MASDANTAIPPIRQYSLAAGFLSYLVPGLGQIYQGRTGKGVLFMVCLLGMFIAGNAMGNWRNVYLPYADPNVPAKVRNVEFTGIVKAIFFRLQFLGQFPIGIAAWPAIWQYWFFDPDNPDTPNRFFGNFQRFPADERKLNEELTNSDKTPDIAWVYTVIAGVLNVLVIYDAYAGPAYLLSQREPQDKPEGEAAA